MKSFPVVLFWARAACFAGQLALGVSAALAVLAAYAALASLSDWAFALSSDTRAALLLAGKALAFLGALASLAWAFRAARRLPRELDVLNRDARSSISCALGLPVAAQGLEGWLAQQARLQAAEAVLQARRHFPALRRWACGVLLLAAVGGAGWGLYAAFPQEACVLGRRLAMPYADIPPLSPYVFAVNPANPETYYGEDLALSARIGGGPSPRAVNLLLKTEGMPLQTLPAFRNRSGEWTRVLENVTAPCSIAFATADGRARSRFIPVRVSHSPRILSGLATVTPLPYTGKPPKQTKLGGSEILVPDGGSVAIDLECNMGIVGGFALFTPSGSKEPQKVEAHAEGNWLHVSMKVRTPGSLSMQVADAEGRSADAPVQVRLAVLPDAPPEVAVTMPEDGTFLVEGHPLELRAEATDDYGLVRFSLFKSLAPYRQHGVSVLQGKGAKQAYSCTYDTAALGVKAGDVLEFRAETGDDNPFRFNIVSSSTVTVKVISSKEYAEILRLETGYKEFMQRYQAMEEAMERVARALEAAAASTPEERMARKSEALQAMQQARDLAARLAADFPAFDMDRQLSSVSEKLVKAFDANMQRLSELSPEAGDFAERVQEMLEFGKEAVGELDRESEAAALVALLAQSFEAQQQFLRLVQRQEDMVKLFDLFKREYGVSSTMESGKLEGLGADQAALRDEYALWEESLSPLLAELARHPELDKMYAQIFGMRTACEQAGVEGLMDQAAGEAAAHRPADAASYARKALEGMLRLLESACSQKGCQNAAQQCASCMSQAAQSTLQQMLEAMGQGRGKVQGAYGPGYGLGRSSVPGRQGIKLVGPGRLRMGGNMPGLSGRARQADSGSRGDGQQQPGKRGAGDAPPDAPSFPDGSIEQVPPAYRDAVRHYFSY